LKTFCSFFGISLRFGQMHLKGKSFWADMRKHFGCQWLHTTGIPLALSYHTYVRQ
jgi:hypothetical protein